eukprot:86328-Pelagomonas_calceolata.AAC.2
MEIRGGDPEVQLIKELAKQHDVREQGAKAWDKTLGFEVTPMETEHLAYLNTECRAVPQSNECNLPSYLRARMQGIPKVLKFETDHKH